MTSVIIKDLVNDIESRNIAHKLFRDTIDIYQDKNADMYEKLFDELDRYPVFNLLYIDNTAIGMSGVNDFYWSQPGVARVGERAFTFNRNFANFRKKENHIATYLYPIQLEYCKSNNIHTVFVSMEDQRRMNFVHNLVYKDYGFKIMPYVYNVCPQKKCIVDDKTCWQYISVNHLTENRSFFLPHR